MYTRYNTLFSVILTLRFDSSLEPMHLATVLASPVGSNQNRSVQFRKVQL